MKEALAAWARSNPLPAVVAVLGLLALALFGWYFRYDIRPYDRPYILVFDRLLGTTTLRSPDALLYPPPPTLRSGAMERLDKFEALIKAGVDPTEARARLDNAPRTGAK